MDYGTVMLLEDAPNIKVSLCLNLKTLGSFPCDMWRAFGLSEPRRIKLTVFLKRLTFFIKFKKKWNP